MIRYDLDMHCIGFDLYYYCILAQITLTLDESSEKPVAVLADTGISLWPKIIDKIRLYDYVDRRAEKGNMGAMTDRWLYCGEVPALQEVSISGNKLPDMDTSLGHYFAAHNIFRARQKKYY